MSECVCVTLCSKEFRFGSYRRGLTGLFRVSQRSSRIRLGYRKRTRFRRTCAQPLIKLFQSRFVCMVVAHDTFPSNRFPSAAFSRHRSAAFLQTSEQLFNNSVALTLSPCVSLIPFDLGIELTANPLSKCVPLCCPTWVHSVIPVTGALISCRTTTNRLCCFLHTLDYLN